MLLAVLVAAQTAPAQQIPDLTGADGQAGLAWKSVAAQQQQVWTIEHFLHNERPNTHIRVRWTPDIYKGYLEFTKAPKSVSSTGGLLQSPAKQESPIVYGDPDTTRKSNSYKPAEEGPKAMLQATVKTSLTVKMPTDDFLTFDLNLVSEAAFVKPGTVKYTITLKQLQLADKALLSWNTANSPQFDAMLAKKHGKKFIVLDHEGKAEYLVPVPADVKVHLRNGTIAIYDPSGHTILGEVSAPAYAIVDKKSR